MTAKNLTTEGIAIGLQLAIDELCRSFDAEYEVFQEYWKSDSADDAEMARVETKLRTINEMIANLARKANAYKRMR